MSLWSHISGPVSGTFAEDLVFFVEGTFSMGPHISMGPPATRRIRVECNADQFNQAQEPNSMLELGFYDGYLATVSVTTLDRRAT
jgi:hypothetical protein